MIEDLEPHLISGSRRYLRALDVHLALIQDYDPDTRAGAANLHAMAQTWQADEDAARSLSWAGKHVATSSVPPGGESDLLGFATAVVDTFGRAETYFVSANMVGFIADVADTLPEDYTVDADSMPSPGGVMVLDTPILVLDRHGVEFRVDVIVWSPGSHGWAMWQFTDSYNDPATVESIGPWARRLREAGTPLARHSMLNASSMRYADPILGPEWVLGQNVDDGNERLAMLSSLWVRRFVVSAWAVMHGKIGRPRRGAPTRQQTKKLRAANCDWGDIRVVELRGVQYTGKEHERPHVGRNVEWTHRWMVRGFWRWQPYTKGYADDHKCSHCGATGVQHRRLFIEPFVKGPDDLPYLAKDVIYAVTR